MKETLEPAIMGWCAAILLFLLATAASSPAMEVEPFYTRNQSPLVQIFGLPPAEGGELAGKGESDLRLVLEVANTFTGEGFDDSEVRLDGEIYRLTLALRHGVGERLELGIDIPYIWHTGGGCDSFIDGFHHTFGLPGGGRENWDRDQLRYLSVADGETELYLDEPRDGFGDLLLSTGLQLVRSERPGGAHALALRAALKLPTGKGEDLTGSGSTDFSLRLAFSDTASLAPWSLSWYGTAGLLLMTDGDVIEERQRNSVGFGTLGIGWVPTNWLALKLQFDGHSEFYRGTGLSQTDDSSVQVTIGFTVPLPGEILLDFGVNEDLVVNTSPDVVFHTALRRRF